MICHTCGHDKPDSEFGFRAHKRVYKPVCKPCERDRAAVRKHGLTAAQKTQIAEHQGGCAICGHHDPGAKGWVVDHDHACCDDEKSCPQCRRGILCGWCNKVLAYAFDRPQILQAAIDYLAAHADGGCKWHMPVACAPGICGTHMPPADARTDARTNSRRSNPPCEQS